MFQQALHTCRVKQLMRGARLSLSLITPLIVFTMVGVISATPAHAQVQTIEDFLGCVQGKTTVDQTAACVPAGCYTTVTMSTESAQPACTLLDGTRLPRVIFSCTGGSQVLRFRPSFSLCTSPRTLINHIELGEDVKLGEDVEANSHIQKMADIDGNVTPQNPLGFSGLVKFGTPATAIFDSRTPAVSKGCADCHDAKGTTAVGANVLNLFDSVFPELAEGTIFTNDPSVQAPAVQTPLSAICAGINSSVYLYTSYFDRWQKARNLCNQLEPKTH